MQFWTYHPSTFSLDAKDLKIDHTMGKYWAREEPAFRYRQVLPTFCEMIGTDQFLWCCQNRHCIQRLSEEMDIVEWELNPAPDAVRFYRWAVWEEIVHSKNDDWTNLLAESATPESEPVVLLPLQREWIKAHGLSPLKYPRRAKRA